MDSATLSRRSLLHAIAATMATAAMPMGWAEILQAAAEADAAGQARGGAEAKLSFLSAAEAADIEAIASQIIPTDDSPGAAAAWCSYRPGARDAVSPDRRRLSRAAGWFPGGVSRAAFLRRLVRGAPLRAADRLSEDG